MSLVRGVLLDLYDTLVWSEWPALRGLIEERTGLSNQELLDAFDETRAERAIGAFGSMEADLEVVLSSAGLDHDDLLVRDLARDVAGFLEVGVHLWDDSLPVLRELRSRGLRTAIVSNCDHGTRPVVERLELAGETDAVLLSFEVGVAKPEPRIYRAALEALGVEPGEAVFADDQVAYCEGAAAVGIRPYLVVRPGSDPGEHLGDHPVIPDLRSLLELV